jgi:hypothetical protein
VKPVEWLAVYGWALLRMVLQGGKGESPKGREENGQGAWGFPLKELIYLEEPPDSLGRPVPPLSSGQFPPPLGSPTLAEPPPNTTCHTLLYIEFILIFLRAPPNATHRAPSRAPFKGTFLTFFENFYKFKIQFLYIFSIDFYV